MREVFFHLVHPIVTIVRLMRPSEVLSVVA